MKRTKSLLVIGSAVLLLSMAPLSTFAASYPLYPDAVNQNIISPRWSEAGTVESNLLLQNGTAKG